MKNWWCEHINRLISWKRGVNPFPSKWVLRALIDFTLSNGRRFYSSMGNLLDRKGLTFIDFVRVSGAKLNENPSIGFTPDEGLTLTTRASVTFLRWRLNPIHSVDSKFLPTNPAVCFIVKSVWFGNNLGLLLGRKCVIFTSLFSFLFFIEDFKCTLDLNIDNYLLPMQSSI